MSTRNKWYIGTSDSGREFLEASTFACDWYWSGGYLGNSKVHHHVSGIGRGKNLCKFDAMKAYFHKDLVLSDGELWRFCDLFKQFYAYREAAECFQYGGHMISKGRTDAEIDMDMAASINKHLETVIIPEINKLMDSAGVIL